MGSCTASMPTPLILAGQTVSIAIRHAAGAMAQVKLRLLAGGHLATVGLALALEGRRIRCRESLGGGDPYWDSNTTSWKTESSGYIHIGSNAGQSNQGSYAVAIGNQAGNISQGINTVAIGYQSGYQLQGESAIAIGYQAG